MRYRELYDHPEPTMPPHPAKAERPHTSTMLVLRGEMSALNVLCAQHDTVVTDVRPMLAMPTAVMVEVACPDREAKLALYDAWTTYTEASQHRPRSQEEWRAWAEQHNAYGPISPDWTL